MSSPRVGEVWRNKHTGREATILAVVDGERRKPHSLAQAPDGRFLFGDFRPVACTVVRYEGGSPPGFDDAHSGGHDLETFMRHWVPGRLMQAVAPVSSSGEGGER